jgi:hypothetical protein
MSSAKLKRGADFLTVHGVESEYSVTTVAGLVYSFGTRYKIEGRRSYNRHENDDIFEKDKVKKV